jgi:hypothetical protein
METYKGGIPNHEVGEKISNLSFEVDDSIADDEIVLPKDIASRLAAKHMDIIYMEDNRKWLGGLRSAHVKLAGDHTGTTVKMNEKTRESAYLDLGRMVCLEKIF